MTETTTVTVEFEIPDIDFDTKIDVGDAMLTQGVAYWSRSYNDNDDFEVTRLGEDGYRIFDPAEMDEPKDIFAEPFFDEHLKLIWLATIDNYRFDWIKFAFRGSGAPYDEYDALTTDAVLQNMLYGEIIYG